MPDPNRLVIVRLGKLRATPSATQPMKIRSPAIAPQIQYLLRKRQAFLHVANSGYDYMKELHMTMEDWIDSVVEAGESCTCDSQREPLEILDELEHNLITCTGYNLNGKQLKEPA